MSCESFRDTFVWHAVMFLSSDYVLFIMTYVNQKDNWALYYVHWTILLIIYNLF